jgi:hypothetical protein
LTAAAAGQRLCGCSPLLVSDPQCTRLTDVQFLMEGLSTAALLEADRRAGGSSPVSSPFNGSAHRNGTVLTSGLDARTTTDDTLYSQLLWTGFTLSLIAMGLPILQLVEQRFVMRPRGVRNDLTGAKSSSKACCAVVMLADYLPPAST